MDDVVHRGVNEGRVCRDKPETIHNAYDLGWVRDVIRETVSVRPVPVLPSDPTNSNHRVTKPYPSSWTDHKNSAGIRYAKPTPR